MEATTTPAPVRVERGAAPDVGRAGTRLSRTGNLGRGRLESGTEAARRLEADDIGPGPHRDNVPGPDPACRDRAEAGDHPHVGDLDSRPGEPMIASMIPGRRRFPPRPAAIPTRPGPRQGANFLFYALGLDSHRYGNAGPPSGGSGSVTGDSRGSLLLRGVLFCLEVSTSSDFGSVGSPGPDVVPSAKALATILVDVRLIPFSGAPGVNSDSPHPTTARGGGRSL